MNLRSLVPALGAVGRKPQLLWVLTDAGIDLDDEFALIVIAALQRLGIVQLLGVSACLKPAAWRWRLVRGQLTQLGYGRDLPDVLVGAGTGMIESRNGEPVPNEENCPYLAPLSDIKLSDEVFVSTLLDADDQSITLIVQSGFTDALLMAVAHGKLLRRKVREVVIMGGVKATEDGSGILLNNGLMVPDNANNNTFNEDAALMFYTWCQQTGMPMVVTMRQAAYRAKAPFSLYDTIAGYSSPIGTCMRERQMPSLQLLWERANAAPGSEKRGPLPPDRDRSWYVGQFCANIDPGIDGSGNITPYLGEFNLYDPFNTLAALSEVRQACLDPYMITINGVTDEIIGLTPRLHGVTRPNVMTGLMTGLVEYGIAKASAWAVA